MRFHVKGIAEDILVELDAHHITPREQMPKGGYVKENGISLCEDCHIKAEEWLKDHERFHDFRSDALYVLIGSSLETATKASEKL